MAQGIILKLVRRGGSSNKFRELVLDCSGSKTVTGPTSVNVTTNNPIDLIVFYTATASVSTTWQIDNDTGNMYVLLKLTNGSTETTTRFELTRESETSYKVVQKVTNNSLTFRWSAFRYSD